jgi:hypothetical protein
LFLSSEYTVEAWVKRTIDSGTRQTFLSIATSGYRQATYSIYVDAGNEVCRGASDQFALYQTGDDSVMCSRQTAQLGIWYHVAVSRNGNGVTRLFVNGMLKGVHRRETVPTASTGVLTLGRAGDHFGEYFSGLIDEVRISNAAVYTTAFIPPVIPLGSTTRTVALWHLDEGAGHVIADSSSHDINGTFDPVAAGPLWSTDTPIINATPTPTQTALPAFTQTPTETQTPKSSSEFMVFPTDNASSTATPLP